MTPEYEISLLRKLLEIREESEPANAKRWHYLSWAVGTALAIGLWWLLRIYESLSLEQMVAAMAGIFIGGTLGLVAAAQVFLDRITALLRIIDPALIKERLHELGA